MKRLLMTGFLTTGLLAALETAGAAGILGQGVSATTVTQSAFCQKYDCGEPFVRGREWQFPYNSTQTLVILRESNEAGSRAVSVQLWVRKEGLNTASDQQAFQDVQRLALGYVPYTGKVEGCYAASTTKTLVTAPDERTAGVSCDLWPSVVIFEVTADPAYLARTAPSQTNLNSGPTKLNQWDFRNCKAGGASFGYLPTGKAARCDLVITTKGEQSQVVRAEFQYEIEYVQNGQAVKKLLPDKEYWWPGRQQGALDPRVSQQGRTITANVSLAVRDQPGRRVTSLNTIARLTFANGAVKTAYEPLLVR